MKPYAEIGAKLVALGYAAIPVMPMTKRPGKLVGGEWVGMTNWRKEYTERLPTKFEIENWSKSDAGVCVVCGPGSKDLVAVDIDIDDDMVKGAILCAIPTTHVAKKGAKGATFFFRGPQIDKSKSWSIPWGSSSNFRACDLIGPGRQTVLPPTIHPDTESPYAWIGTPLCEIPADQLPELTPEHIKAISEALEKFGYCQEETFTERELKPRYDRDDDDLPIHRRLNNDAMDNFDAWVPKLGLSRCRRTSAGYEAVAEWRASSSGREFGKRKYNLKFHREGIKDFGDGPRPYTPLNVVKAAFDLGEGSAALDQAYSWLSDALGWNSHGFIDILDTGKQTQEFPTQEFTSMMQLASEIIEVRQELPDDYDSTLERLTHCKGLIGDIVDWIEATAQRPNRALALGAAVTVLGTLIGRRIAGPTHSATHLYWLALAPTASGKQHPLDCLKRLMMAIGAKDHIGPGQFMSYQAIIAALERRPLQVVPMDEFGAYISRINSRKAGSFEKGINDTLRTLWGLSFELYSSPEWAAKQASHIAAPAMSIFGVGTPDEFYDGLQSSEAKNGFLNRFLVVNTTRGPAVTPKLPKGQVPEHIVAPLKEIFRWGGDQSELGNARLNDETCMPDPIVLNWATAAAKECFVELQQKIMQLEIDVPQSEHYMGRTAEIAVRLATIRAVGRHGPYGDGPAVDLSDMEWGRDLAVLCGERLAKDGAAFVADNDQQQWSKRILNIVRENGETSVRDIQRKIQCGLRAQDLRGHLDNLCEAGFIEAVKGDRKGKLAVVGYKFVGE